jgi:molecular chaperone DnaK (HSP70)
MAALFGIQAKSQAADTPQQSIFVLSPSVFSFNHQLKSALWSARAQNALSFVRKKKRSCSDLN